MAFPTTSVLDTFTGSNGVTPPNANWSQPIEPGHTSIEIQNNRASPVVASTDVCDAYYNVANYGPDVEAFCTIAQMDQENGRVGLACRLLTPNSSTVRGYLAQAECVLGGGNDIVTVYRIDSSTAFAGLLTIPSLEWAIGDKLGIEMVGSLLTIYRMPSGGSWGAIGSVTDTTYTGAGRIGLYIRSSLGNRNPAIMQVDDFGGGTVVVPVGGGTGGPKNLITTGAG